MNLAYSFLCIAKKSPFMIINFCNYPSIHLAEHETFVLVVTRLIVYLRLSLHFYGRPKIDNCVYQHGEQMPPCFGFTKSGFQPTSLSCPKKVEIVFLLFCKVVSIDCILILFVFFLKTCLGIPAKSPSQQKSLRSSWYLPWDTLYCVCGHFFHFFHFFLQFISPLFLHISPGTHSAASVSALVKTNTNITQTFNTFAVCDL